MASYQIVYWQEIPSQVDARDEGGKPCKQKLSERFQELIDIVATARNKGGADDYMEAWTKGGKLTRPGTAREVAQAVASELEAEFEAIRAKALAKSGNS